MNAPAQFVDRRQVRRNFARAASSYDEAAVLQREIGKRMLERLDYVRIEPQRVLDLGCGTGASLTALHERYPGALVIGADPCLPMLRVGQRQHSRLRWLLPFLRGNRSPLLAAEATALPLPAQSIGLLWSNLMLHWLDDPLPAFGELHRTLAVGGLLTFAMLGPDTLKELRVAGATSLRRFADMHDVGDMLVAAGFADPVMDMDMITFEYRRPRRFLADQRHLGVRNGLLGRMAWRDWRRVFARWHGGATFEVVYGHAWKAEPRVAADGRAIVRFAR